MLISLYVYLYKALDLWKMKNKAKNVKITLPKYFVINFEIFGAGSGKKKFL